MAAIGNLTVKKADGTTDIIYTALQGASGDGGKAIWRQEDLTLPQALRTLFVMTSKDNGNSTARKVHLEFLRPVAYTDSTTGLKKLALTNYASSDFLLNKDSMDADIAETVHQFTNLTVHADVRSAVKAGLTPN